MTTITGNVPFVEPPEWAVLERSLIDLMNDAVKPVMEKYVREDGSVMWPTTEEALVGIDGLDDAYESFFNWPVFYMLGGGDHILELSHKTYDGITDQFARYDTGHGHPMVVKEYEQGYDWMHQGEGYVFFYSLCLADPQSEKNRDRARRYAGFYLNEDPDAINYDPEKKILLSPHLGAKGPAYRNWEGTRHYPYSFWKVYPLPFLDIEGIDTVEDLQKPGMEEKMAEAMARRLPQGDVAVNLASTSLVTNAYLFGGDDREKYKRWILEYVDAWIERTKQNDGILPDNVSLSGEVGEYLGGRWYGGNYGWTWPHGWGTLGDAVVSAAENALVITGDSSYLDLPRSQIDIMAAHGELRGKTLHVPENHNDDGWFRHLPLRADITAHIWAASMADEDMGRIEKFRNHEREDHRTVTSHSSKHNCGHEAPWISYLQGDYPEYPAEILRHNHSQVYQCLDFMRNDTQDPSTYGDWYLQARNPISVEGLLQLTMGAPLFMYNGGLLHARLRYFDAQRRRPGLPGDVAAPVEKLTDDGVAVQLVNLNPTEQREIIVQAGAYGEHRFTSIVGNRRGELQKNEAGPGGSHPQRLGEQVAEQMETFQDRVDDVIFTVLLEPGCGVRLELGMERYVGDPSYRMPWN